MQENVITSLCYVDSKNDKTTRLCRIADYEDGQFYPYKYDSSQEFFCEERDLLFGQNYEVLAEPGEIAVFNWYPYLSGDNQWRTNVKRNNDISWCEVLPRYQYEGPDAVISDLRKDGVPVAVNYDAKRDLIIVTATDTAGLNAVYLRKENAKLKNGRLVLADNVFKLSVGAMDVTAATESCQCRYLKNEQRFLLGADGYKEKMQKSVKKPVEVVRDILQGNAGYFDSEVMTRREKQLLRSVIARVTEPTVVDMVCDRLDCTVQEAHEYINQYIETAKLKLDRQTALSIIEKLVQSDVDAVLEMKKAVKEDWISENEALVAEKKKEIEECNEELRATKETAEKEQERVRLAVRAEENRQNRLEKENDELSESVAGLKKLKEDLETEIQKRLNRAKEDLVGAVLDHALITPVVQQPQLAVPELKSTKAYFVSFSQEETEEAGVYDCHDVAQTDWNRVCGDEDMASGLALLALAAFACNRSVLVAGEGAETIADLLSVTVCGHMPLKLRIRDEADLEAVAEEIEAFDHQIICVINGLESGYAGARELIQRFRDSRFIFTAMHSESLLMEPESLFSAFFPVLTDYFYNGRYVQELSTLDCSGELLKMQGSDQEKKAFRDAKKIVGKWLKDEFFPPVFKARFAQLIAAMIVLSEELDIGDTALHTAELELVLVPWLKCLRRTELLQRILEEDTVLDEYKKKDLLKYIGADGI